MAIEFWFGVYACENSVTMGNQPIGLLSKEIENERKGGRTQGCRRVRFVTGEAVRFVS